MIELMHSDDEADELARDDKAEFFALVTASIDETVFTSPCFFSVNVPGDRYQIITKSPLGMPGTSRSSTAPTSFPGKHVKSLHFHYARPDSTASPNTRSTHPAAQEICFLSMYLHSPPQPVSKHALLEFKSDLDLLRCIELLRTHAAFHKLLNGADLPPKYFSSYAKVLLAHYAAEKKPTTVTKPCRDRFVGDQHPDRKLFNYPIQGGDPEKIKAVANNLTEAKGPVLARSTINTAPNLPIKAYQTVVVGDYLRLAPGQKLNDPLINFFLCWYVPFSL
jgi:hypothetical protein